MFLILLFCFTVLPVFELYLLFKAGAEIGALNTIGLVLFTGFLGAALAKAQGFSLLAKIQSQTRQGEIPTDSLIEGVLILAGGLLLLTPGFITDVAGLLLVIPFSRKVFARFLRAYFARKVAQGSVRFYTSADGFRPPEPPMKDANVTDVRDVGPNDTKRLH